jgi:hypothetical protein
VRRPGAEEFNKSRFVTHHEAGVFVCDLDDVGSFAAIIDGEASAGSADGHGRVDTEYLVHAVEAVHTEIGDEAAA